MKQLFTIACTLVLGGALAFAQTGATATKSSGWRRSDTDRHVNYHQKASQTWRQEIQQESEEGRYGHHRASSKSKPFTQISCNPLVTMAASRGAAFFLPYKKAFFFQFLCLECCATILCKVEGFQKLISL